MWGPRPRARLSLPHPGDTTFKAHLEDLDAHRPFRSFRYWYSSPSGSPRLAEINGKPFSDEDGEFMGYRGTASDITKKFEAEERFRAMFEKANFAMLIVDTQGLIQLANQKFWDMLGYSPTESRSVNIADITHPEDLKSSWARFSEKYKTGSVSHNVEQRYISKSGEVIWGDLSVATIPGPSPVRPLYYVAAIHDISVQKEQADALKDSEARYKRAARPARTGHWIWDHLEDKCTYASPEMSYMFGRSPDTFCESLSSSAALLNWVTPNDRSAFGDALQRLVSNGIAFELIAKIALDDNSVRHFHFLTEVISNTSGNVTHSHGVLMDISVLRETEDALRQSQKLEMLGQLTGGIAHDFNNLLAVIVGNLELLSDTKLKSESEKLIASAIEAANRGADLTKSMLSFARDAHLQFQVLDLNQIVNETKSWTTRTLPAAIDVEMSLSTDLWQIEADLASTESAILNLILNARDAMPDGGKLSIETSNVCINDQVNSSHEDLVPGRYVMLAISDTGSGIDADTIVHVFEPFFTTKGPSKGSGLGLSMVQGFMKQSGGSIQIYSKVGEGTTLKLYFRPVESAIEKPVVSTKIAPIEISKGTRILVADDQPELLSIFKALLESNEYVVITAGSGNEALEVFETCGKIDLLLTDVAMPGEVQGPQLAKRLRDKQPELAIVFMSGYVDAETVNRAGLTNDDKWVMKPISKSKLISAIEQALGEYN